MSRLLLALTLACAGLASGCAVPLGEGDAPLLEIPGDKPPPKNDGEAAARAALAAGRYGDASSAYNALSQLEADPRLRAEFLFLSAEASLGEGEHYLAYFRYARLLRLFPWTTRYAKAVDRLFLIGRLFCEGKARKPSWLFGIAMSDEEFGIEALERFQRERERHRSADDALHYVALAYMELRNEELAIESWSKLRRFYPESEWAETAQYRAALAEIMRSDGVRYDKQPLLSGLNQLESYAKAHPQGNHIAEVRKKVAELRETLAGQLLRTARYYESADEFYSTHIYLSAILTRYPKTDAAVEAKALAASVPRVEAPAAPPEPDDLETGSGAIDPDRLRIAPAPIDDTW